MKNKFQPTLFFFLALIAFSCNSNSQKCGSNKFQKNRIVEFNLCKNIIDQDTAKGELLNQSMGPDWEDFDGIKFILPKGYKIIDAKLSAKITPSIWPDINENVIQYLTFSEYSILCKDVKKLKINENTIMHPMELKENLIRDVYFKNAPKLRKDQLVNILNKRFEEEEIYINELKSDTSYSAKDIQEKHLENEREKKVYLKYLNNFTTLKNANKENFGLLAIARYLTLSIENNNNIKKVTFEYFPVYGN
jgi:hypothetical protein